MKYPITEKTSIAIATCAMCIVWMVLAQTLPLYQLWAIVMTIVSLLITYLGTKQICKHLTQLQKWKGSSYYGRQSD